MGTGTDAGHLPLEMGQPVAITGGLEMAALICTSGLASAAGGISLRDWRQGDLRQLLLDLKGVVVVC